HGTLHLKVAERFMDTASFQKLIASKLLEPGIAKKRIRFSISIDREASSISLAVEDDGNGFDHEAWIKRVQTDQTLNIDEHGRGISLLYHLSDQLEFSNGGRHLRVTKKIDDAPGAET
ncbi:MAG: ATP-binding protein, partial [Candidatus Cloacimonadaceae bacterium]|nr:ATP-binding protein [Candidatus Cloacimonadaceae bacterium]